MSSLLRRLSIQQSMLISVFAFSIALIVFASISIVSNYNKLQNEKRDGRLLDLMDALEKVAHNHAVERGLTAGYLGAPDAAKKSNLDKQRLKADASIEALQALANQDWPDGFHVDTKSSLLLEHNQGKGQIRRQVDTGQAPGAFSFYSTQNKLALDSIAMLRGNITDWKLQAGLTHALNYAWFKERAGQARGKINGTLARRQLSGVAKGEISSYINEIQLVTKYLKSSLEGSALNQFNQVITSQNARDISQIHQQILASEPGELADSLPDSGIWFPLATQQIGDVKKLLDAQWQANHEKAQFAISHAQSSLWIIVLVTIAVVGVMLMMNIYMMASMHRKLAKLTQMLRKISQEGDLTTDVRLSSTDELGDISRAIHETIYAMKDLIVGIATSVTAGERLSGDLNAAAEQVLHGAQNTLQVSTNMATAVEEMAATSGEIAKSAAHTLSASDELNNQADQASQVNSASEQVTVRLASNMQEVSVKANSMDEQVKAISVILQSINELADQTNLLALNAAIEAARAGEHGRGFAVVADEVRKLAKGSQESSAQISDLLQRLQEASVSVVDAIQQSSNNMDETSQQSEALHGIYTKLKQQAQSVEQLSTQAAAAAEQQSVTANNVAKEVAQVSEAAQTDLDAIEELNRIYKDLNVNNGALQRAMRQFRID